ncbi:MAG: phosphoribosylamine--glycine ligase [Kiritimatiellae bacterium]|nr:phosphoribosylamine--glycine ligase [Kiritimatiellia bacterium]
MKILIIGGGGREHAIAWRLSKDSCKPELYCAPGNAGTDSIAENLPISAEDIDSLTQWAICNKPDLTVVGPEVPLCLGITDIFEAEGLRVFGPCREAAKIEGSKRFSKEVMAAAGVPTARSLSFDNPDKAIDALESFGLPVVIKADGLAAGKGVIIAETKEKAVATIQSMLIDSQFGEAGAEVLIEEFLKGEEASILALIDGENALILPSSQDHKRAYDNDEGPNTGGMGAYSPAPVVTDELIPIIKESVIMPVIREMKKRGCPYKGVLYAGLMINEKGMNVLEFNARFGDPETEAVLPRIDGDIIPALEACIDGTLNDDLISVRKEAAVTIVMASEGYPGSYPKGIRITGLDQAAEIEGCTVFNAGTKIENGKVVTSGGRVLSVTAIGTDLKDAVEHAYQAVAKIDFKGAHYRKDIAFRAFNR